MAGRRGSRPAGRGRARRGGIFPLLNGGELAIVYCFAFLYFWLAGGGEWSLDRLLGREGVPREIPSDATLVGERWAVSRVSPAGSSDRETVGSTAEREASRR